MDLFPASIVSPHTADLQLQQAQIDLHRAAEARRLRVFRLVRCILLAGPKDAKAARPRTPRD